MALTVEQLTADDLEAFVTASQLAFGHVSDEDSIEHWGNYYDPAYALGVRDGGRIVATAAANRYRITLPGGSEAAREVDIAGVTAVGVAPTHRRRGLLTKMMNRQLGDLRKEGLPLAILYSSESGIYGRFGYGLSTSFQAISIARHHSAFSQPVAARGRFRFIDKDEAWKLLPEAHDRLRTARVGEISRPDGWWASYFRDPARHRRGANARLYAIHEAPGGAIDGFVSMHHTSKWPDGIPSSEVRIVDFFAATNAVRAALWRFVLDTDLVETVDARCPLDDPLRWLLADPRRMRTVRVGDGLWTRILDVPAALNARGYADDRAVVLEVADGRSSTSYHVEGGECRRARKSEPAEIALGIADLGAIYLGGVSASQLAAAGRIEERARGALARADSVFAGPMAPFCSTDF